MDYIKHNQDAWDGYVDKKDRWTIPVSNEELEKVKQGIWNVVLTPSKSVPINWFPELQGLKILGLASGGGQQGPVLAALGAEVSIFDNSEKQLQQDQKAAKSHGLNITTQQGDMRDLSVYTDESFDLIFNPCSTLFVDDLELVWKECFRVLRPGGILMTGFINPVAFQIDDSEDSLKLIHKQPYSDLKSLSKGKLEDLITQKEPLVFGHSLTSLLGGLMDAGFVLTHMFEDDWKDENPLDKYFPSFIAVRARKT